MKVSSIFKYLFLIFAIGIIVYAGYRIYNNQGVEGENNQEVSTEVEENIIKDIRLALTNYDTMNPLITNNKEILNIDTLVYEPLFTLTQDYKLEPCLAKECSKTGTNIYVIKLNSDILWQDGTKFTAKDVQFTIDTIKQGNSIYKYNVQHIASTEIVDDTTIKIMLDADIPFIDYNFTFPIMSSNYYAEEDFYSSNKIPIGTGKYKISSVSTNNVTLTKNEKWRNASEEIKIDSININIYSSMGEAYNNFKLGNIDLLNTSNSNFQEYIGTIGFNKYEYAGRQFDFLSLNCTDTIMQDKAVRQALSYAIDRVNIVSTIFNNQNAVAEYPLDYGNYLYEGSNASSGYNPEQAKKVLEERRMGIHKQQMEKNYKWYKQKFKIKNFCEQK